MGYCCSRYCRYMIFNEAVAYLAVCDGNNGTVGQWQPMSFFRSAEHHKWPLTGPSSLAGKSVEHPVLSR